jgi:hypothetical protein
MGVSFLHETSLILHHLGAWQQTFTMTERSKEQKVQQAVIWAGASTQMHEHSLRTRFMMI